MSSIEENLVRYENYTWDENGDEWSKGWGNSKNQWDQLIYPKIEKYLGGGAETLLEIAVGRGRWTCHLEKHCQKYIGVDLSPTCIEFCKRRFPNEKFKFYANDGLSLAMIPDNSCDFIFSFDSLVHCEMDVLEAYLTQMYEKLGGGKAAFLHYSNAGGRASHLTPDTRHFRAKSTSASSVINHAQKIGLSCAYQELITWGECEDLDSLTIFVKN